MQCCSLLFCCLTFVFFFDFVVLVLSSGEHPSNFGVPENVADAPGEIDRVHDTCCKGDDPSNYRKIQGTHTSSYRDHTSTREKLNILANAATLPRKPAERTPPVNLSRSRTSIRKGRSLSQQEISDISVVEVYRKNENGGGYFCNGVTDSAIAAHNFHVPPRSIEFFTGDQDRVDILIQNRTSCQRTVPIHVSMATVLNVTVETCCIKWCTHEVEIRVEGNEQILLNFMNFTVPGLNLARSEAVGVCDESLDIVLDNVRKASQVNKTHVIGSFCGIKQPSSVFVEYNRVKLILSQKDNNQCVNNINYVVQIMPCLKFQYQSCDSSDYVEFNEDHGYISSPGLNIGQNYPNDIQCLWNISVPEGRLIELTPNDIRLKDGDVIQVFPKIADSRRFPELLKLSNNNFRYPIVLPSNECVMEFHSDSVMSGAGFYISYQAVSVSKFIPMFDNRSLDCSSNISIPNELTCNYYIDCANGEDEENCFYKNPTCWPRGYAFEDRCYQAVYNQPLMSWTEAEEFCERNLSSHLFTIGTINQKKFIDRFIKFLGPSFYVMFLGLQRMRMQQVTQMYRRMWQWTDGTTAFFLPSEYRYEGWSTCSLFHGSYFHSTDCGAKKENISFICERKIESLQPKFDSWNRYRKMVVTAISTNKINVFHCHSGEYISIEQRCDKVDNCFDRSDELDCEYERLENIMFSCDTQGLLSYTFVCDGIGGCLDSSDEKSCATLDKSVLGPKLTTCTDGMLLERSRLCDGKEDCRDASDEEDCTNCVGGSALCPMIACIPRNWQTDDEVDCPIKDLKGRRTPESNLKELVVDSTMPPGIVIPDGYGKFQIIATMENHCPPTHAQCKDGYCIPVYMFCNGMTDCPYGEDEEPEVCEQVCVGMYKCKYKQVCVHNDHLCDGIYQCPNHDDELLCGLQNITCPQNCSCLRMEFTCSSYPKLAAPTPVRYLRIHQANIPNLNIENIAPYSLIYLNVSTCNVKTIKEENFNFINLKILDLSHNAIETISDETFIHCHKMRILILSHNKLNNVKLSFLEHIRELSKLDLSYNIKNTLEDDCFYKAVNLEELILRFMQIETIFPKAFNGLLRLKRLDLKGNELITFSMNIFNSQKNLRSIVTDNFRLCCSSIKPSSVQFSDCDAPYDEISSCADILRTLLLRVALWLMAILTVTGNFGVIVYRIFYDRGIKYSFRIIITCLSASDLIMGIYLVIIGAADVMYRDRYLLAEREWKSSMPCKVAGFLCLLSSETSALFILLVTVDRLLAIAFPLHPALHFNAKSATVACGLVWIIGLTMATVPLLPPFQHWELYSQKAVGVPLPITRLHFPGYDYAFAIFILFNMAVFLLVAMGQLLIYLSVHLQKHPQISEARVKQDTAIAKRLVLVVITDCLCWFPITVMGLAARSGQPVPGEMYLVTTVFLLPANSAFNPFLYTANAILLARRNRRKKKASDLGYELRQLSQSFQ